MHPSSKLLTNSKPDGDRYLLRLLVDTHAFIWAAAAPERLSQQAALALRDPDNDVLVSAVSGWEIAIKRSLGRLRFPDPDSEMLAMLHMGELPVTFHHTAELATLERHHRDPFDRMLIAQALGEDLKLVSADRVFHDYDVALIW